MLVFTEKPRILLKNILVATDFSPASESALDHAIGIARHYGSKILLVHAIAPVSGEQSETEHKGTKETIADAEQRLRAEAEKCGDIECHQSLLTGTALEVVEHFLSLDHLDLIVVGTHGTKGFRKLLLGSVAEKIFHHVRCPVLALGPLAGERKSGWKPKRVVLATDLESDESRTVEYATALAKEHNADLALLHVTPRAGAPYPEDTECVIEPYFRSRLRALVPSWPGLDYPLQCWVEFGDDPAAEIVRVASTRAVDLIVLSVKPREPWSTHFVHGGHRIVAGAPCPVLIVQRRF